MATLHTDLAYVHAELAKFDGNGDRPPGPPAYLLRRGFRHDTARQVVDDELGAADEPVSDTGSVIASSSPRRELSGPITSTVAGSEVTELTS